MVEYSKLTLTQAGAAMNAKMIAGQAGFSFTKVSASDATYQEKQLASLTSLSDIKQTTLISKVERTNNVTISIEVAFTNMNLSTGYYMRTLGLYALDPTDGEILYAVCVAKGDNCYMPPNNGVTSSGAFIKLIQTVGNADNVLLSVDPGAVATIGDIQALEKEIENLNNALENSKISRINEFFFNSDSGWGIWARMNVKKDKIVSGMFELYPPEDMGLEGSSYLDFNMKYGKSAEIEFTERLSETDQDYFGDFDLIEENQDVFLISNKVPILSASTEYANQIIGYANINSGFKYGKFYLSLRLNFFTSGWSHILPLSGGGDNGCHIITDFVYIDSL